MTHLFRTITFSLLLTMNSSYAAESPETFAKELITSLEQNNTELFESLILPKSLELSKGNDSAKHDRKIARILKLKKPSEFESYKVTIIDIEDDKNYDSSNNSLYIFGNKRATFPIKLEKKITIFVKTGIVDQSGEWETPHMSQVLSCYKGKWYMAWPDVIK